MTVPDSIPGHYKRLTYSLIAGFFFLLGAILLSCFGPEKLSCSRIDDDQIDCRLTQSVAFGLIQTKEVALLSLAEAKIDKRTLTTIKHYLSGPSMRNKSVYEVFLIGNKKTIFGKYDYSYERQKKVVNKINHFINDSMMARFTYQYRRRWLNILIVLSLGLSFWFAFKRFRIH